MVVFAVVLPGLAMAAAAAVEYSSLASRKSKLQNAADSAALAGAQQLRLVNNTDGAIAAIVTSVVGQTVTTPQGTSTTIESAVIDQRTAVKVTIRETVTSLTGKLLSLPTMDIGAEATAKVAGNDKLCLLVLEATKNKALNLDKDSQMTAQGCAIYSNSTNKSGISAEQGSQARASLICSGGGVQNKGYLFPQPTTDCPPMGDPLASVARPAIGTCKDTGLKIDYPATLWPGTYCKGVTIGGSAIVTMMPGVYVMDDGPLIVSKNASLIGIGVGIFFTGNAGGMRLDPDTTINLTAPKDGPMAGLLFAEDRSIGTPVPPPPGPKGSPPAPPYGSQPMRQYQITSNNAPNLLGTIYLPAGRLIIDASMPVANRSAYTVIVVRQLELNSGPNLYLNTDYDATDIPVPQGVGSKAGAIRLVN